MIATDDELQRVWWDAEDFTGELRAIYDRGRADALAEMPPAPTPIDPKDVTSAPAVMAGRCLATVTHRDDDRLQSVCMLPSGHMPLVHDDCMGCTWTDADHWQEDPRDTAEDRAESAEAAASGYQAAMHEARLALSEMAARAGRAEGALGVLRAQRDAALKLHELSGCPGDHYCYEDDKPWPCPTARALGVES